MKTLIVVTGPTAVGKTELCTGIAERYHIPVINADSRQIYKGMRIGTAAPDEEQLKKVEYYFVGCRELDEYYNASMYEEDVLKVLDYRFNTVGDDIALLSGGSMMYIDAVCNGIDDIPTIDPQLREEMKRRLATEGLQSLLEELKRLDPEHYATVDRNNPRRVVHALEICHQTGGTYSALRTNERKQRPFAIKTIVLNRPREELYSRINARVDAMMAEGLLDEARGLLPYRACNALNTVGYKEMFNYLDGIWSLDEAVERLKGNTRRYARKQLTWFKKYKDAVWFNPEDNNVIMNYISQL